MGEALGITILVLLLSPFVVAFMAFVLVVIIGPIYAAIMSSLNRD